MRVRAAGHFDLWYPIRDSLYRANRLKNPTGITFALDKVNDPVSPLPRPIMLNSSLKPGPDVVSSFPVENFQISPFQHGGTVTLGCAHDKKQTRGVFSVSQKRQYRRIPRSQKPTGTERKFVFSRSYRRYVYGWRRPEICRYLSVGGFFDLAALKRNIFLRLLLLFFFFFNRDRAAFFKSHNADSLSQHVVPLSHISKMYVSITISLFSRNIKHLT